MSAPMDRRNQISKWLSERLHDYCGLPEKLTVHQRWRKENHLPIRINAWTGLYRLLLSIEIWTKLVILWKKKIEFGTWILFCFCFQEERWFQRMLMSQRNGKDSSSRIVIDIMIRDDGCVLFFFSITTILCSLKRVKPMLEILCA